MSLVRSQYDPLRFFRKKAPSRTLMWNRIQVLFETHPERLQVAEFLLKNGFSIKGNRIYVNEVEVPTLSSSSSRS